MSAERWALVDRVDRLVADVTRLTAERDAARSEATRLREALDRLVCSIGGDMDEILLAVDHARSALTPPTDQGEAGRVCPASGDRVPPDATRPIPHRLLCPTCGRNVGIAGLGIIARHHRGVGT